jgi:hypothetical protein
MSSLIFGDRLRKAFSGGMKTHEKKSKCHKIVLSAFAEDASGNLQAFGMVDNPIGSESYSTISALFPQQ